MALFSNPATPTYCGTGFSTEAAPQAVQGGEQLGDFAFLRQLPDLDCNDETSEAQLAPLKHMNCPQ